MARRKDVYRGKRRHRFPVVPVVTVLVLLLAAAAILFYGLQKYAVYGKDGVTLAIPGLTQLPSPAAEDETPSPSGPRPLSNVPADIVVDPADYSGVSLRDGADLAPLRGRWYTQKQMRSGALARLGAATDAQSTLVLEMVDFDGALFWASDSQTAQAYAVNGQADLPELLGPLKDKGYSLVAAVSCTRQTLLAKRCPAMALRNAAGDPYADERGAWLDPYSLQVREYLLSLITELRDAGFDEVVLTGLSFPLNDRAVYYAQQRLGASTPRAAVSALAVWMGRNAPQELTFSVWLEADAVRGTGDEERESVQDAELYCRVFDRLYLTTGEFDLPFDAERLAAIAGAQDMGSRFVPVTYAAPESGSYVLTDAE